MKKLLILGLMLWNPLSACRSLTKEEASQAKSSPLDSDEIIVESPNDWKPLPDLPLGKFLGNYEGKTPGLFGKKCSVAVHVATYGAKWRGVLVPALYFATQLKGEIYQDWTIPLTYTTARDDASLSALAAALKKSPESGSVDVQGHNAFEKYAGKSMDNYRSWVTVAWDVNGFKSIQSRYNYSGNQFQPFDDCQNLRKTESYTVEQTDHPEM